MPNIDFWHVFWQLIDSPKAALTKVIQSEKKNFIFFLLAIIALKVSINAQYIYIHGFGHAKPHPFGQTTLWMFTTLCFIIIPLLLFALLKPGKRKVRLKDLLAVVYYSHLPVVATFFLLFIPQFILWGPYLFTNSPSPFLIYKSLAIFFTALEAIALLWSLGLLINGLGVLQNLGKLRFILATVLFLLLNALPAAYLIFF